MPRYGEDEFELSELQEALLNQKIIDLSGPVDDGMALYVRTALAWLRAYGSPDIEVHITSEGGSADICLDICDMLRLYRGETRGIAYMYAYSAAAFILQACHVRQATLNAKILIHHLRESSITLDTLRSKKKMADLRKDAEKVQKKIDDVIARRTGKTILEVRKECRKDEVMTAEEALAFGLIDEII